MLPFYKKQLIILWLFTVGISPAFAQKKPLTTSRQNSVYTYIYKLNSADVQLLHMNAEKDPGDRMTHTRIDSFLTNTYWKNTLPAGNYLKVYAEKNKLNYALIENRSAYLQEFNNNYDTRFIITDATGKKLPGAEVLVNNKPVKLDVKTGTYIVKKNRLNLVEVKYAGISNFYSLDVNRYNNGFLSRNWLRRQGSKIKNLFKKGNSYNDNYRYRRRLEENNKYSGFMVFNKPKYKPHDTIKFKAFVVHRRSNKPVTAKRLLVRIQKEADDNGKVIGYVNSYRDGGYEYSFVLNDSLDISLDEHYTVSLEDPGSIKYNLQNYDGDDDDEKYLSQRKVYIAGKFEHEEYELKSITFSMRTDKKEHERGNPLAIYLKAVDENNLSVQDGRADLIFMSQIANAFASGKEFVPDTLWRHKVQLDAIGETKILIPDSIFPRADLSYFVNADFYNSNNEHQSQTEYLRFKNTSYKINTNLVADTLHITALIAGTETKLPATLYALNKLGDTTGKTSINLPANIRIDPRIQDYIVKADSIEQRVSLYSFNPAPVVESYRTADSVSINVKNPHKLHFWYWLYNNKKMIDAGQGERLSYKKRYTGNGNLRFVLNYLWAGSNVSKPTDIVYQDKLLTINVKQPISVYPGQQVKTEIEITDIAGKPVANTDVTAWALTRKFTDYATPYVPYLGNTYPYIKPRANVMVRLTNNNLQSQLNWAKWGRQMGLDSIAYYQFTHPKTLYKIEEPAPDSVTQIAPFVVKNGDIDPVHVLFIDDKPVYFSQAGQLNRYSFAVPAGKHHIRFRTLHNTITLDSVRITAGKKLILSVNADTANKAIGMVSMPDTLLAYEAALINKYMFNVVDNFGPKMATLQQRDKQILLNPQPNNYYNNNQEILVGPLSADHTIYSLRDEIVTDFVSEPGYSYLFGPGLLRQKGNPANLQFLKTLQNGNASTTYTDYALTLPETEKLWKQYLNLRSQSTQLFRNAPNTDNVTGKLRILIDKGRQRSPLVKNVLIFKEGNPDFIQIYPGNNIMFEKLSPGNYRLFFLLENEAYYVKENVAIRPNGTNYYAINLQPRLKDSVSTRINDIIINRTGINDPRDWHIRNDALKMSEAFNSKFIQKGDFKYVMYGRVTDAGDKLPLPGVSICIKGTNSCVQTDINGKFTIKVPETGKLLFNYIGYQQIQEDIKPGEIVEVKLLAAAYHLNEVVVTGYGVSSKRIEMGYASTTVSSMLSGKVAGLQADTVHVRGITRIVLRGNRSSTNDNTPLYVLDGVIVPNMNMVDPVNITEISVLKGDAGIALYGARAANGVIVISTKRKGAEPGNTDAAQGNGQLFRKNFSDYAYWQPKLITDAEGKTSFTSTFPDDITNWRTFVVGINGNRQTGVSENQIKSFKPLSANLIAPQFAVAGDEMSLIGKVMNYNSAPVKLSRAFIYNGQQLKQDELEVSNSKIDTLHITAAATDSLTFEYSIKRDNGYFDGEKRMVPVIKQGVQETKGLFEALHGDTTVNLKFDDAFGPVTFRAEASALPALAEEAKSLREYKYLCNEQLASKLKGLLAEKRIKTYLGEPFKYDKNVNEVIKKLQDNRRTGGTWGWWKDSNEELWISLHAVEALVEAANIKYTINLDKQRLTDYLVLQMESYKGQEKLACLQLLHQLNAKVDYAKYTALVAKEFKAAKTAPPAYDKLKLLLLRQMAGITVNTDSLIEAKQTTLFGNIYWGDESYQLFDNSIQETVLAYRIIRNEGKHPDLLGRIRGYLLEQRKLGQWRNTYEAALILETILPDVLTETKQLKPATITIKGSSTITVNQFPYTSTLQDNAISVSKTGLLPVYITGYQQFWNSSPKKVSKDFTVDTWFERDKNKVTGLKGGEAIALKVEVTAKGDGDFVMIEVPIPAGCSYEGKAQGHDNNEVHREYFKEKVSIFCRKLKKGTYTFNINLMPRYSGNYTLNPAKAELMYFPVFYGREEMRKMVIGK